MANGPKPNNPITHYLISKLTSVLSGAFARLTSQNIIMSHLGSMIRLRYNCIDEKVESLVVVNGNLIDDEERDFLVQFLSLLNNFLDSFISLIHPK